MLEIRLLADGGSTKTAWQAYDAIGVRGVLETKGMNPVVMTSDQVERILCDELKPWLVSNQFVVSGIEYYGAGCRDEAKTVMANLLTAVTSATDVVVDSDLLGAARALCGDREGIACILGTGANSGLYDGTRIVQNTPCLGFIIGDEGGGATLGKILVGNIVKRQLPDVVCEAFWHETGLSIAEIVRRVYREPAPNRFLASLALFIGRHREIPEVREMVVTEFRRFFVRNIVAYDRRDLPVNFVGSVAYFLQDELAEAARLEGFKLGKVQRGVIV